MPAPIIGQPKPPPGWYPDQQSSSALRWWDGQQWTSYQAPLQGNASSFPQASLANPYPITNHHSTHAQEQVDFHHLLSDEPTVRAAVAGQVHAPNGRQGPWLVIAGLISVFFLVFFLVGTTTGVLNAIGLPSRGDGFVRLVVSPLMSAALAYFLFRLSSRYFEHRPSGTAESSRLHRRAMKVGAALAVVATLGFTMFHLEVSNRAPTLTGPELQEVLREHLGQQSFNPQALTNTLSCPKSREYSDGDVARCSMNLTTGSQLILVATLYRVDETWRVNLGFG